MFFQSCLWQLFRWRRGRLQRQCTDWYVCVTISTPVKHFSCVCLSQTQSVSVSVTVTVTVSVAVHHWHWQWHCMAVPVAALLAVPLTVAVLTAVTACVCVGGGGGGARLRNFFLPFRTVGLFQLRLYDYVLTNLMGFFQLSGLWFGGLG